ncbi:MAG: hypothetical protein ILO34_08065 [Kiritimatiellae bacterium]|nr:hypothetical protein [Kiritimatiellia bacterium]
MKSDAARLALVVMVLAVFGALEELLPKFAGVGFPLLLSVAMVAAARWNVASWAVTAIAAGAAEDALASLPPAASATFFLASAALVHWGEMRRLLFVLVYPAYLLWLCAWSRNHAGNLFGSLLLAAPIGALTVAAVGCFVSFAARRAGIDER